MVLFIEDVSGRRQGIDRFEVFAVLTIVIMKVFFIVGVMKLMQVRVLITEDLSVLSLKHIDGYVTALVGYVFDIREYRLEAYALDRIA